MNNKRLGDFEKIEYERIKNLASRNGISLSEYKGFNPEQLRQILIGLMHNIDVSIYAKKEFGPYQMKQLRSLLEKGHDVSKLANPMFSQLDMIILDDALMEGFDSIAFCEKNDIDIKKSARLAFVTSLKYDALSKKELPKEMIGDFSSSDFNCRQKSSLLHSAADGIPMDIIAKYADPKIKWSDMHDKIILDNAKRLYPDFDFSGYTSKVVELLVKGLSYGYNPKDLKKLVEVQCSGRSFSTKIPSFLEEGLDIHYLFDKKLEVRQIGEILLGLEFGLDVSFYADPENEWYVMKRIRELLEYGVKIEKYTEPFSSRTGFFIPT